MSISENIKLVIFAPVTHSDVVRQALGEAGAGRIGNYDFCSFSTRGTGRYKGNESANPAVGTKGVYEFVEEDRIEVVVPRSILGEVIVAIRKVHPYEEMAYDVYPLETL